MIRRFKLPAQPVLLAGVTIVTLALGCSKSEGPTTAGTPSETGSGGAGAGTSAIATAGSGVGPGTGSSGACEGGAVADSKRVVRLSFNQFSRTIHALLGDTFGAKTDADFEIGAESPTARTFPPLSSPQEGSTITTGIWQKVDLIASAAGSYALANLDQVTGCGATPSDACAEAFLRSFAEKAYRRPLSATEASSILQVYSEVKGIYGVPEAIQHSVYAIMQSPQLLYRTELGESKDQAGPLTPYELASSLSYFLSDSPPDSELLTAAQQQKLSTSAEIAGQVDRILGTPTARKNLEAALFSYFQVDNLATVKIDDATFTSGSQAKPYTGLRESAYHEVELFLGNNLWNGPLTGLLTTKKSWLNTTLSSVYGITLSGVTDESQFVETEVPANRGGLLTKIGFLAANSRPDVPSVVARGLAVNKSLLCQTNPSFPTDPALVAKIEEAGTMLAAASERDRAAYRAQTQPCAGCHRTFDAYGLALDSYDSIGRYRTMDPQGRAIDSSVTLPTLFDNQVVGDAVAMQNAIAQHPGFAACFSRNMLNWALAEGSQLTPTSCATQAVVSGFNASDKSFGSLLREVAVSQAFTQRNAGGTQ
ncbi:MAG TPA: DUF1592 domain-containing protein [Polyangiaceae bacterium]|nr:DUF1592 domain-containing protein [Polyangiaceae bacterium]